MKRASFTKKAEIAAASLRAVSDRYHRGEISYEQMDKMQRATWALVEADAPAVKREVDRIIRGGAA